MSTIVKADANGAVTLPAELCRAAGVTPGTDLAADVQNGRIVVEPAAADLAERIAALAADCRREDARQTAARLAPQHDHYLVWAAEAAGVTAHAAADRVRRHVLLGRIVQPSRPFHAARLRVRPLPLGSTRVTSPPTRCSRRS